MHKIILFTLLFVAPALLAQSDEELMVKFQEYNNMLAKATLAGNEGEMLEYYTDDVISLPSYQPALMGIEEIKKNMDEAPEMDIKEFELKTREVFSSGNLAVEVGSYKIKFDMPRMSDIEDVGKYLTVWEKQDDGSWKIKAETWNTNMNPWMEMMEEHDMGKPEIEHHQEDEN
ncbi:MAG: hypothetical protein Kow0098_03100 [Ignavibacteriaceae bacterium]